MFKKVLQSLTKSLASKPATLPPKRTADQPGPLEKVVKRPGRVEQKAAPAKAAAVLERKPSTPDEMCGITPGMTKGEIHDRLKLLYRRFNRSASSLDPKVRSEADAMMDAIVDVREKHLGEI